MKRIILILVALVFFTYAFSQNNVGIGTTTPNTSAVLDVAATDMGLLVPRVALTQTTSASPVTAPATSLLVYNTATINDVTPGYYYWDGSKWSQLGAGVQSDDWALLGNAGTNSSANFLGTTDAQDLVIRTNNTEKIRVLSTGNVGIGIASPIESLDVSGNIRATGTVYWGSDGVRTETRNDAGAFGAGIRSGFFQTSSPSPAANWPTGASGWWHLLDIRHTNITNNYAMQFAGDFNDQKLYFRKTNGNAAEAWNEVITSATETYKATSLNSDILITTTSWTDLPGMTLTFVAKKPTVMIMLTAAGHGYTNSMAYVSLRVWNNTTGVSLGGTSNKIQAYDDMTGTVTVWNAGFTKVITGLTVGTTYSVKVQGKVDGILGTDDAVLYPVTYPDSEHMTLTVFY